METSFILLGLVCFAGAEIFMAVRAWHLGGAKFTLSLFVPGYGYLLARRNGFYWPYFLILLAGAALLITGAILSTFK